MEWQAGYASGALLVPRSALLRLIGPVPAVPLQPESRPAAGLVETVRRAFAVSGDAARVRIAQLGFLARQETLISAY